MPNLSRNFAGSQGGKVKVVKKPRRAEKVEALTTNGANPLVTAAAPSLAIRAVRVSGHVGKLSGKMGVYALDAAHSPKRGVNVYSQMGVSGVHMHKATDGRWYVYDTAHMVSGEPGGWIHGTTGSPSPLGVQWEYYDGSAWIDPQLTVTEMSAAELAAELAAARAAAEAETQRSLAIRAVRVTGHVGTMSFAMGAYALDTAHSPKRGVNVYSLVGASWVHLHKATDGEWWITIGTDVMVAGSMTGFMCSTTASPSPLGLQWKYSDSGFHLDPLLTVTEMSAADLVPAAVTICGREHGIRAVCMGRYSLHSRPGVLPPVYRRDEAPHRFFFRGARNYWNVSTDQTKGEGSLRSASAAPLISGVLGGKSQWMVRNAVFDGFTVDPNIYVRESRH